MFLRCKETTALELPPLEDATKNWISGVYTQTSNGMKTSLSFSISCHKNNKTKTLLLAAISQQEETKTQDVPKTLLITKH